MEIKIKYKKAIKYKNEAEYDLSWEIFRELLKQDEEDISAEMLYNLSEVLKELERIAQAGMYLRKALKMSRKTENATNFYLIAKINIHLENEKASLFYLKKAIDEDTKYIEMAQKEDIFESLKEHKKFIKLTQKPEEEPTQVFLKLLSQNQWNTDDFKESYESKLKISPQVVAEYTQNPELNFKIAYYADTSLVYLELQNTEDKDDEQAYRFYTEKNISDFLVTLINYQNKLNPNNWEDFLENIIPTCKEVSFEMPDGRQVKIS